MYVSYGFELHATLNPRFVVGLGGSKATIQIKTMGKDTLFVL
jgi:hypothetical protein